METQEGEERVTKASVEITANIPARIIKKLAKVAGLTYREEGDLGGGLCVKLEGAKNRRRALGALGALLNAGIGEGKTERALEAVGASWLDVVGWCEEDEEYMALWEAMEKVRLKAASAAAFDKLMDRAINGYDAQEARTTRDGVEVVTVRKYDNTMAVNLLKSVGFVGGKEPVMGVKGGRGKAGEAKGVGAEAGKGEGEKPKEEPPGVEVPAEEETEVMYGDRESAFRAMGAPASEGLPAPVAQVEVGVAGKR